MGSSINFLVFQWFFVRLIQERVPLIEKYKKCVNAESTALTKESEYIQLIQLADERPEKVSYPPDLYDLLNVGFYEWRWVRAWPLTGWVGRIRTF